MPVNPYLLSENVGNGKYKYLLLGVTLQGDETDEAKAKEECDAVVNKILAAVEAAEEVRANTWKYVDEEVGLSVTVSAQTKEDADKQCANRYLLRLAKASE